MRVAWVTIAALLMCVVADGAQAARHRHPRDLAHARLKHLIDRDLARRPGSVTLAIYDVSTKERWSYNHAMRNDTASIVKVDILETRLNQTHGHLSGNDRRLATAMIEQSDNNAATALWNEDGGAGGIGRYNGRLGMRCTSLNPFGYWGLTLTCARDQLRLLNQLSHHNRLLSDRSRRYQLYLMEHVVSWESWGVSAGVPRVGVSVALKNGWLPYDNAPWIVNSIGIIHGNGRYYYIAALTRDPTEADGISTIESVSRIVWKEIPRRRLGHKRRPEHKRRPGR